MADWQDIVSQHSQSVWRTAYRLLGDYADACDCLQDAFLAALHLSRKEEVRNWRALLVRLATAKGIDRLRERIRLRALSRQASGLLAAVAAKDRSPEERAQGEELAGLLRRAIAQLPGLQAQVFCLRHLDDLSYEEIASEMGLELNHIGVLLHRARERLKLLLARTAEAEGGARP